MNNISYDENDGKWIIDTDPGVDDACAIIFANYFLKKNLIALSIEGGNVGLDQCAINAKKIVVLNQRGVPAIYKGCKSNLSCLSFEAKHIHGTDGLFNIDIFNEYDLKYDDTFNKEYINSRYPFFDSFSPLKIIEFAYKYEKLNLLAIGPLTNLAVAFMLDPNIVNKINKLVIMGGSYTDFGNFNPPGEFNFVCDPIACKIVLDNFKRITVYPWEACLVNLIIPDHLPKGNLDYDRYLFTKEIVDKKKTQGGVFADYGAAIAAFYPKAIKKSFKCYANCNIDGSGWTNGKFICFKNDLGNVEVVEELHADLYFKFFEEMIKN